LAAVAALIAKDALNTVIEDVCEFKTNDVACNPSNWSELVAKEAVPVKFVAVTDVRPAKVVTVEPNPTKVLPIVEPENCKLCVGIEAKPKVIVSVPALPERVNPCPDEEAKVKVPEAADIKFTPLTDAVEKELYPAGT
jgi:hypothetical protein